MKSALLTGCGRVKHKLINRLIYNEVCIADGLWQSKTQINKQTDI